MCTAEAVPAGDDASDPDRDSRCDPVSGRPCTVAARAFAASLPVFTSTSQALRMAVAALDYLNTAAGNTAAGDPAADHHLKFCR